MNTWFNQLCISLVIKIWDVITTAKTYLHFILFLDWKWMSLDILTVQTDFDIVCNRSPCTLLMSCCRETPVHQQPASWLVFKNVKWPVVYNVFATLQPLNKRRHKVNHDLLIRLSLIYRYVLYQPLAFSSLPLAWLCFLAMWTALVPAAIVLVAFGVVD